MRILSRNAAFSRPKQLDFTSKRNLASPEFRPGHHECFEQTAFLSSLITLSSLTKTEQTTSTPTNPWIRPAAGLLTILCFLFNHSLGLATGFAGPFQDEPRQQQHKHRPLKLNREAGSFSFEKNPKLPEGSRKNDKAHFGYIINAVNIDKEKIATVSSSGFFAVWEKSTGRLVNSNKVAEKLWSIERLENNQGFVLGGGTGKEEDSTGIAIVVDETGTKVKNEIELKAEVISILHESGDEYWMGSSDRGLRLVNIKTGKVLKRIAYGSGVMARVDKNRILCGYSSDIFLLDTSEISSVSEDKVFEEEHERKRRVRRRGKGFVLYRNFTTNWICHFESDAKKNIGYFSDSAGRLVAFNLKNKRKIWIQDIEGSDGISWFHLNKDKTRILALDQERAILMFDAKTGKQIKKIPIRGLQYGGFTKVSAGKIWVGGLRRPIWVDIKAGNYGLATDPKVNKEKLARWIPGAIQRYAFNNANLQWRVSGSEELVHYDKKYKNGFKVFPELRLSSIEARGWTDGKKDGLIQTKKGAVHFDLETGKPLHTVPLTGESFSLLPDKSGVLISGQRYQIEPVQEDHEGDHNGNARKKRIRIPRSSQGLYTYQWGAKSLNIYAKESENKYKGEIESIVAETHNKLLVSTEYSNGIQVLNKKDLSPIGQLPVKSHQFNSEYGKSHFVGDGYVTFIHPRELYGSINRERITLSVAPKKIQLWIKQLSAPKYSVRQKAFEQLKKVSYQDLMKFESSFKEHTQTQYAIDSIVKKMKTAPILRKECRCKVVFENGVEVRKVLIDTNTRYWVALVNKEKKSLLRLITVIDNYPQLVDELSIPVISADFHLNDDQITVLLANGKTFQVKINPPKSADDIEITF